MVRSQPTTFNLSSGPLRLNSKTQVRHKTQKFAIPPSFYPQNNRKPPQQLPRAKSGHKYLSVGEGSKYRKPVVQHNVPRQHPTADEAGKTGKTGSEVLEVEANRIQRLDKKVEDAVNKAADTTLGLNTFTSVREFCGFDTHQHFYPYIRGFIDRYYLRSDPIKYIWYALRDFLPDDPLNKRVTSVSGTFVYNRFRYTNMKPQPQDQQLNRMGLAWYQLMSTTAIRPEHLLPDGTNARFLPGPGDKWPHRLWAGGSITLHAKHFRNIDDPTIWHMAEVPRHLRIEGPQHAEKAFVTVHKIWNKIESRWPPNLYNKENVLAAFRPDSYGPRDPRHPFLTETYTLCFSRDPPNFSSNATRIIKPPMQPKFQHTLTPNRHLLFCWSALTFNAHLIHLDPDFTKRVYGAPNLLVHGPLTVFLVLEWFERTMNGYALDRQLPPFQLRSIEYKNLTPLYIDEPMTLCTKPTKFQTPGTLAESWEVWIEKNVGDGLSTMAFKGTIKMTVGEEALDRRSGGSASDDAEGEETFTSPFFS